MAGMLVARLLVATALTALTACHSSADDGAPSSTCAGSARGFCASTPEHCPTGPTSAEFCAWFLRNGHDGAHFGDRETCADGGLVGYAVQGDAGPRVYLYGETGVAAIFDLDREGYRTCVAGSAVVGWCGGDVVAYVCDSTDAGDADDVHALGDAGTD